MSRTRRLAMAVATVTATAAIMTATPHLAVADNMVSISDVANALTKTDTFDNKLVADAAKTAKATVPTNPKDSVSVGQGNKAINIGLPNAKNAKAGHKLADGTMVYPGTDGSANAVVPTNDGVQMLTTIKNRYAPTRYTYQVNVPTGGEVKVSDNGTAAVFDAKGNIITAITAPWAKDANGKTVPTHYETDGKSLTQIVEHNTGAFAYPVVADPRWIDRTWYGALIVHLNRAETNNVARGWTVAGIAGTAWWQVGVAFGLAGWWATDVYNQGLCLTAHVWPNNPYATWWWSERC